MQGRTSSLWCLVTSRGRGNLFRGASSSSVGVRRGQHGSVRNELVALMFRHLEEGGNSLWDASTSSMGIKCD